jgi:hypothetical protein
MRTRGTERHASSLEGAAGVRQGDRSFGGGALPSREFESVSDLLVETSPAAVVDRYLADAPIDEVTDFELDLFQLTRRPRPGETRPVPPGSQETSGSPKRPGATPPPLDLKLRNGEYRLVSMNAGTASGRRRRRGEAVSPDRGGSLYQNYARDILTLKLGSLEDEAMPFSNPVEEPRPAEPLAA